MPNNLPPTHTRPITPSPPPALPPQSLASARAALPTGPTPRPVPPPHCLANTVAAIPGAPVSRRNYSKTTSRPAPNRVHTRRRRHLPQPPDVETTADVGELALRVNVEMNLPLAENLLHSVWRICRPLDGKAPKSKSQSACSLACLPRATDHPRWNSGPCEAKILLPFERPPLEKLGIRPVSP